MSADYEIVEQYKNEEEISHYEVIDKNTFAVVFYSVCYHQARVWVDEHSEVQS